MPEQVFNKNDKQVFFNQVRGIVDSIEKKEKYTNVIINIGHKNIRQVCMVSKNDAFSAIESLCAIGSKVCVKFYISSYQRNDKWFTSANILEVESTY